jgi:hypothetical protein
MKKQAHAKNFCTKCLYSAKGRNATCPKCGAETTPISHKFHLPSMNASKAKWKKFFEESMFLQTGYMNEPEKFKEVVEAAGLDSKFIKKKG